ncbi:MAG: hypothetical protein JWQ86_6415 [Mycobacterium sp.]|jgi:hypothetical protein|nr:hypothetical protein [Mycobacterium sp.]
MIGCAAGHELGLPRATGRLKKYTHNRTPLRHRTPRRAEFPHLWLQHYLHRTVLFLKDVYACGASSRGTTCLANVSTPSGSSSPSNGMMSSIQRFTFACPIRS